MKFQRFQEILAQNVFILKAIIVVLSLILAVAITASTPGHKAPFFLAVAITHHVG